MESQGGSGDGHKESQAMPLVQQKSIYNLTLDEVQNHFDDAEKPLSSLNLDELLQNVWTVESNLSMDVNDETAVTADQTSLQHLASLTITSGLSRRTTDEVWRDIHENKNKEQKSQERQTSLGETTLEEFLVETGILAESSAKTSVGTSPVADPNLPPQFSQVSSNQNPQPHYQLPRGVTGEYNQNQPPQPQYQHPQGVTGKYNQNQPPQPQYQLPRGVTGEFNQNQPPQLRYQHPQGVTGEYNQNQPPQPQYQHPRRVTGGYMLDLPPQTQYHYPQGGVAGGYILNQPTSQPAAQMDKSLQQNLDIVAQGRKRGHVDPAIAAEKRLKRMVKNRESAVQSRQKKQAYLKELERRVSDLKVTNIRLKRLKKLNESLPSPEIRNQLRRTSSI